jgi:hypothetical protein
MKQLFTITTLFLATCFILQGQSVIRTELMHFIDSNNKPIGQSRTAAKGKTDLVSKPAFFINKFEQLECKTSLRHSGESWYSLPINIPDNIESLEITLPGFNISSNRWDGISELFFFYLVVDIEITQVDRLLKAANGNPTSQYLYRQPYKTSQTTSMKSIGEHTIKINQDQLSNIKGNVIFLTYGFTDAWEKREFNFQIAQPEVRYTTSN